MGAPFSVPGQSPEAMLAPSTGAEYRPYAFQVIAPYSNDRDRNVVSLEATMQSLVLDEKHPVALEITGEATQKRFLIRTVSEAACEHAKAHIRVRYPQVDIRPLSVADR